jgi:hypothetical protein
VIGIVTVVGWQVGDQRRNRRIEAGVERRIEAAVVGEALVADTRVPEKGRDGSRGPSSEPSSTTRSSQSVKVWRSRLPIAPVTNARCSNVGMITDTAGCPRPTTMAGA